MSPVGLTCAALPSEPASTPPDPPRWTARHTVGMAALILLLAVTATLCNPAPSPEPTPGVTGTPAPGALQQEGLLLQETFADPTARERWQPISGEWLFTPGALVQAGGEGFSAGIGYVHPLEWVALRVVLQHEQGSGGGLIFNAVCPDTRNDAHVVLFQGNRLVWGYYNLRGEFIRQGSAPVQDPGPESHTLDVVITGTRYAVRLDGVTLGRNAALINTEGYIGLLSVQGMVRFTAVEAYTSHTYLSSD